MNLPTILILCTVAVLAGVALYFHFKNSRPCCGGKNKRGGRGCSLGCGGCRACGNAREESERDDLRESEKSKRKNTAEKK
ncbi:MAG: hypothetical protein SOX77_05520 [Candidatus Borkfalkiaceae bacterium]|nr:hypothetical protein [Christensenellaceae bacterium]